jgi:hypothetical protein
MSHSRSTRREQVDSRLLVVGSQTASLTPDPSFAHNLGCRCPNGSCEAILDMYTSRPFQLHQERRNVRGFDPYTSALSFRESRTTLVATPLWAKCEGEAHTPENSKHDCRGQNSSHLSALSVIGKILKCRCPKWPRMSHLDICSPSYGQKKGRESNWQFDSRPLKVGNRHVPDMRSKSVTWRWKALFEGYNFGLDLVPIGGRGEELRSPKPPGLQPGTVSGLLLGSPRKKSHLDVASAERCRVYYMGEGGGFPRVRAVVSFVCQSAHGLSQHPRVSRMRTNRFMVGFWMQIRA